MPNEQVASSERGEGEAAVPTWEALLAISYYLNGFLEGSVDRGERIGGDSLITLEMEAAAHALFMPTQNRICCQFISNNNNN